MVVSVLLLQQRFRIGRSFKGHPGKTAQPWLKQNLAWERLGNHILQRNKQKPPCNKKQLYSNGVFSELFLRYSVRRIRGTLAPFLWVPIMFSIYRVPLIALH